MFYKNFGTDSKRKAEQNSIKYYLQTRLENKMQQQNGNKAKNSYIKQKHAKYNMKLKKNKTKRKKEYHKIYAILLRNSKPPPFPVNSFYRK